MSAMQHICVWLACEDERFQVCRDDDCPIWRWSPAYSETAANEAFRKTAEGPRKLSRPICGANGPETTNHARPTEGMTA